MKFVGGAPCLDFVNTVGGWVAGEVRGDQLETYADLVRWARLGGWIGASEAVKLIRLGRDRAGEARRVLARARRLRVAIHRLFQTRRPAAADLNGLQSELAIARQRRKLTVVAGAYRWSWDKPARQLDSILWLVAESAADLLTSADLERVRCCSGENCGWLFLDSTRNHSRHWCDMKVCGNLAKVRRFRERQAVVR